MRVRNHQLHNVCMAEVLGVYIQNDLNTVRSVDTAVELMGSLSGFGLPCPRDTPLKSGSPGVI